MYGWNEKKCVRVMTGRIQGKRAPYDTSKIKENACVSDTAVEGLLFVSAGVRAGRGRARAQRTSDKKRCRNIFYSHSLSLALTDSFLPI